MRRASRPSILPLTAPGRGTMLVCPSMAPGEALILGDLDKSGVRDDQVGVRPVGYSLVLIGAGQGTYREGGGREHRLTAGMAFERVPGVRQSTRLDAQRPWRERFLCLGPHLAAALQASGALPTLAAPVWKAPAGAWERLGSFRRRVEAHRPAELPTVIAEAVALIAALRPPPPPAPTDAVAELHAWLCAEPLARHDLAAWCAQRGESPDRLRKAFTRRHGQSPTAFRLAQRMQRAGALLDHGGRSVAEVAAALGYRSPAAFSAQFGRLMGRPPGRWRRA